MREDGRRVVAAPRPPVTAEIEDVAEGLLGAVREFDCDIFGAGTAVGDDIFDGDFHRGVVCGAES